MGYDIVIVAGQSNAVGCGKGKVNKTFKPNPNVFIYKDPQNVSFEIDDLDNAELQIDRNWHFVLEQMKEKASGRSKTGGFYFNFCQEYVNNGLLEQGRKLLIVSSAVCGAGFARKEWGVGNVLHDRLVDLIDNALKLEPDSKLVGFLWHQGEHDSFENASLNFNERKAFYYEKLKETVLDIRNRYSVPNLPFVAGEFVEDWIRQYPSQCKAVLDATQMVCDELGNAKVVSSKDLKSNNQMFNDNDTAHFCRKDCYRLGKRYFKAYQSIINK